MFELHGHVASQGGSAKKLASLLHTPVSLQFRLTHFETHVQMPAQSGSRYLRAAASCLKRITPVSSKLFCSQLMRIDAYPRHCSLRVRLLCFARFSYFLRSLVSPFSGSAILFLFRCLWPRNVAASKTLAQEARMSLELSPADNNMLTHHIFKYVTPQGICQFACSCLASRNAQVSARRSC